ncbi:protein PHOTOSYSTEM I ASSEMBLY 2, chloroplastic-like [Macadamia integrifolia]|uniref:protein PHOTOSYSTEM I ASSEMBLY 2, chloroplastic-like n=1 Tax=Macadamia integrifolia TaxID=60698 RepID=UPI001C4E4570|nr:protein PHOTOSYSTEM I ASSEMBLY 2, chloroplastic-like [Macadamia integrifolia]
MFGGMGMASHLSPTQPPTVSSLALPRNHHHQHNPPRTSYVKPDRLNLRASLEDESHPPRNSGDSSEPLKMKKGVQPIITRRWCLTCVCSTLTLINISNGSIAASEAAALEGKERPVCRNCGGSGAIICKSCNYFFLEEVH